MLQNLLCFAECHWLRLQAGVCLVEFYWLRLLFIAAAAAVIVKSTLFQLVNGQTIHIAQSASSVCTRNSDVLITMQC